MVKKAVIEILLVNESAEKLDEEIREEIFEELSKNLHIVPWATKIEKVTVSSGWDRLLPTEHRSYKEVLYLTVI